MCGRFCLYSEPTEIFAHFSVTQNAVLTPRYNIAPTQVIPVVRSIGTLDFLTWGLRPVWLKEGQNAFINARLETLNEKPAFKHAFKTKRCLIPANGYYEWKQVGTVKQPYLFSLPQNKIFAFAGLWDGDTCALITTTAQPDLAVIHHRMPLIIDPQFYALWLDPKTSVANLQATIQQKPYHFTASPVSTKVNNPRHDFLECTKALQ
ncbi:MAG TPA: SOS response-associated peptidase [Gammaproteobacteria bacterium]|nr:SOS response-associated peptidase [Gammaproteobacteria bacterium]